MLEKIKINNFYKVENENKNIKFLMIQRKQTMAYVDLIRGKYNENDDDQIDILSKEMTVNEINNIKNKYFDELWDKLWINHNCISYKKEYEYAKNKFLKFNLSSLTGCNTWIYSILSFDYKLFALNLNKISTFIVLRLVIKLLLNPNSGL